MPMRIEGIRAVEPWKERERQRAPRAQVGYRASRSESIELGKDQMDLMVWSAPSHAPAPPRWQASLALRSDPEGLGPQPNCVYFIMITVGVQRDIMTCFRRERGSNRVRHGAAGAEHK